MAKSIKLKNDTYIDTGSITHQRNKLSDIIENIFNNFTRRNGNLSNSRIPVMDFRNNNFTPNEYYENGMGVYFEFKQSSVIGISSSYWACLMTIVPWNDSSGGYIIQIAFCVDYNHPVFIRSANGGTGWNPWTNL